MPSGTSIATIRGARAASLTLLTRSWISGSGTPSRDERRVSISVSALGRRCHHYSKRRAVSDELSTLAVEDPTARSDRGYLTYPILDRLRRIGIAAENLHGPQAKQQQAQNADDDAGEHGEARLESLAEVGHLCPIGSSLRCSRRSGYGTRVLRQPSEGLHGPLVAQEASQPRVDEQGQDRIVHRRR